MTSPPPPDPQPLRVAVIGGGISGLAAAHRCIELAVESQRPLQLTLFEAGDRVGGVVGTTTLHGYLVERGGDMFITSKPWGADLCRRLGLEDRLIGTNDEYRRSLVLRKGRPVPVPEGFMLLAPAKIWPVLASPLFSPWGKLRLGLEYFVRRRQGGGDESLASFVRRRFGREALDRLVQPLVGGIYTSDPEQLSLLATMPRFLEMERRHGSLIRASRKRSGRQSEQERQGSGARYGLFVAPDEGMCIIINELERRVKARCEIRLNARVAKVVPSAEGGWSLTPGDVVVQASRLPDAAGTAAAQSARTAAPQGQFDRVIVALRAPQAADLLADVDPSLFQSLRKIPYASSALVVSGHRLADVRDPLDAFGLVIPQSEGRKILAVSYASRKLPGRAPDGRVLLRTFVGGAMQPELLDRTDEELRQLVLDELRDILGVGCEPDLCLVLRYENAMPQYHVGHLDVVREIEERVAGHRGLALAGNAYHGVGIPDCIHSGELAAERALGAPHHD